MASKLNRLIDSIAFNGCVCLNIDEHPIRCRKRFKELALTAFWETQYANQVKFLELPAEYYTAEEEDILLLISTLSNLQSCTITGGRYGKSGQRLQGGLSSFPASFSFSSTITYIDLRFNQLEVIPTCLMGIANLRILMLDYNSIEVIPELCELPNLEELYVRNNNLNQIDSKLCNLSKLKVLKISSNVLVHLPDTLHLLQSLELLDISNNLIKELPCKLLSSASLTTLQAGHNKLESFPCKLSVVSSRLHMIDLRYNYILHISVEVEEDDRILLAGNTPQPCFALPETESDDYNVPLYALESDCHEISLSHNGACYKLPSGIKILFPNGFACDESIKSVFCNVASKELTDFCLRPTDQLLSIMLELQPSGMVFKKAISITLPYCYSGFDSQKREIVMRVTSFGKNGDSTYEDLRSQISEVANDDTCTGEVTAFVNHFSIFAVVSRLVEDTVIVDHNSAKTVYSSVDSFTRLSFPKASVEENTRVTMQVLLVSPSEVQDLVNSSHCPVSNVLHVDILPAHTFFNQPITVHLALPPSLMGKVYDNKQLRLLKCPMHTEEWNDVTDDVHLVFSTVDVSFQINSFSKFWLAWSNVCGVARKVYRRIITYDVQFLAMQKATLPSIVMAQCVRADQLNQRIKQLLEAGYKDEDSCTVVQELMEGDQFRVKVRGEIKLKSYNETDKQHLETRVLVRKFHSQYPPEKSGFCKFCIEPVSGDPKKTASGYVSFYKICQQFCDPTESVTKDIEKLQCGPLKRKVDGLAPNQSINPCGDNNIPVVIREEDESYLDDVLLTLKTTDATLDLPQEKEYQLCFGELGTGMFKESNLRYIASQIGVEWQEIGHYLGIRTDDMDRMKLDCPGQTKEQIFLMLKKWAALHMHEDNCVHDFVEALRDADRNDLAEKILRIYETGMENFKNTIKRRKEISTPNDF